MLFASLAIGFSSNAFATVHHQLEVTLAPAVKSLAVQDHITGLNSVKTRFLLHRDLMVHALSPGDQIRLLQTGEQNEYEVTAPDHAVTLQYSGVIFDPVKNNDSSGLVSVEGAVLFGSTHWLPDFSEKATYEITKTTLPTDWKLASPLEQTRLPQQEIYFIAGPFHEEHLKDPTSGITLKVFLRNSEPGLARTFLSLLPQYLDHYQTSLGAYPYDTFAVIENFWETGFGMPGFTLLGPGVIRLPYILNSSLPHELLHNWWGNSVYVDYQRGNWCEGLTTYLADHWQQEVANTDREYRRQSLMNFQDYSKTTQDFPLREFKQRFNFNSQAVGYGKGMMFFHMLKKQLGDDIFAQGLRDLYQNHQGQSISYEEIQTSFERSGGTSLKSFFNQWLDRTGAPTLKLTKATRTQSPTGEFQVSFELSQVNPQSYELSVPLRVGFADGSFWHKTLPLKNLQETYKLHFLQAPTSLEIDPEVDIFRDLDVKERPLSLSALFGSKQIWLVGGSENIQKSFQQNWQSSVEGPLSLSDDKLLLDLPLDGAVVLLGDSPVYEKLMLEDLKGQAFSVSPEALSLLGRPYARKDTKTVLMARSLSRPGLILVWIRGENFETLAPRLLHFGKYGVLVFADKSIPLKATWPILQSPLKVSF